MSRRATSVVFSGAIVATASAIAACGGDPPELPPAPARHTTDTPSRDPCVSDANGSFFDDFECPGWSRFDGPCADPNAAVGALSLDRLAPDSRTTSLSSALPDVAASGREEACLVKIVHVDDPSRVDLQLDVFVEAIATSSGAAPWQGAIVSLALEDGAGESMAFGAGLAFDADGAGGSSPPHWTLLSGTSTGWHATTATPPHAIPLGRWFHLDLALRDGGAALSVDGIEEARIAPVRDIPATITQLRLRTGLAGAPWEGTDAMRAHVDDVELRTVP